MTVKNSNRSVRASQGHTEPLLRVSGLKTYFETDDRRTIRAVDGVSFHVNRGEIVCIVGESGSGKSVTAESITRIIPSPPGEIVAGSIEFDDREITTMDESALRSLRGGRISHIFQSPYDSLNPVYTVGYQIREALYIHTDLNKDERHERAIELLDRVGIPDAAVRVTDYPHEFSGGMRQRVMIAMALACQPDLLIADEPTTALDVTIEAQILELLTDLRESMGMSIIFITHDLGVVAEIADRVVVLYAGKVMETGTVYDVFETPSHPYTRALLACLPGSHGVLRPIGGAVPDPVDPPAGCRFHPRCRYALPECTTGEQPPMEPASNPAHTVSCVYYQSGYDRETILGDNESGAETSGIANGGSAPDHEREGSTNGT